MRNERRSDRVKYGIAPPQELDDYVIKMAIEWDLIGYQDRPNRSAAVERIIREHMEASDVRTNA